MTRRPDRSRGDRTLSWGSPDGNAPASRARRRTGIEQEFVVSGPDGPVDFTRWIRAGAVPGKRLDRADPNAHRQPSGGVITADGREAEIATAPAPLAPGFTDSLSSSLHQLRAELAGVVGGHDLPATLDGVSTHLNVEIVDARVVRTAGRFAQRHSAAMMLLLDRRDSPGLLVRPRRGRLEVGGEYATGTQLTAAAVFAAAAALDCERFSRAAPLARARLEPARERFGWYVDRQAFGPDLYRDGRQARIGRHCAQDLLDWSWSRIRPRAEQLASAAEVAAVDAIVEGRRSLPCEHPEADLALPRTGQRTGRPVSDLTADRSVSSISLSPLIVTWDHTVFALSEAGAVCYVALPAHRTADFVEAFSSGLLVRWSRQMLATPQRALPVLSTTRDVGEGGVFGGLAAGVTLSPRERDPVSGRLSGSGAGPGDRQHKHDAQDTPARPPRPRAPRSRLWPTLGAAAAVLAIVATAFAVTRSGSSTPEAPAAAPGPSATSGTTAADPLKKANEAFARSMAGTYKVTMTAIDGNASQPVGTVLHRTVKLGLDCSAAASCTLTSGGVAGKISGGALRFAGTFTEPCPDKSGKQVTDRYDTTLRATDGGAGIRGVQHIESINTEVCADVVNDPVAFSWVGTRR